MHSLGYGLSQLQLVTPRRMTLIVALFVGVLLSPVPTAAQDSIPPSTGSTSVTISITDRPAYNSAFIGISNTAISVVVTCPSGKLMVGVAGSKLKFIQKITPLCAILKKDGSFADLATVGPAPTVGAFQLQCEKGHVVTRLRVSYHENTAVYPFLGGVEIGCTSWSGGLSSGLPQAVATTGFDGWPLKAAVACSNQYQPGRALRIRATTAVKALSLKCDEP
jgi:hypothetical protein